MATASPGVHGLFAALGDPTRYAIVEQLCERPASVSELAKPFDMSMPAVSKPLRVLEHAGLIARSRDGQLRPCRLMAGPLKDANEWLEDYRRFWEASFDRLSAYLEETSRKRKKRHGKKR